MVNLIQKASEGRVFEFDTDKVSIKVSAADTSGTYSLMRWTVAPFASAPAHAHERYEETFYLLEGDLEFVLGYEVVPMSAGDFVRVPAKTRHGYRNKTSKIVEMLVGFTPGGMEELFFKYRTDTQAFDAESYAQEAREIHGTEYESGS